MSTKPLEKPMNFKQARQFLGVSSATLYRRLYNKEIVGRKMGGLWVFMPSDLQRYINQLPSTKKVIKMRKEA